MTEQIKGPECIGIIMDGNRRWAKDRGLAGTAGHSAGFEKLKEVLTWANEAKIKYVITYAFSTENWKREKAEVDFLMDIFRLTLKRDLKIFKEKNIRLKVIGVKSMLPKDLQEMIGEAEAETASGEMCLVLAVSYGGRAEILSAVKALVQDKKPEEISQFAENDFAKYLWTSDVPDPDLVIRTSGEYRTSNFLPWQTAYSEWFFLPEYWPAITKEVFDGVLEKFSLRKRRLGK